MRKGNTHLQEKGNDYIMGDEEVRDCVERMKVGEKVDSDHQPVEVWIRGKRERKREEGWKGVWNEEGREAFRESIGKVEMVGEDLERGRIG